MPKNTEVQNEQDATLQKDAATMTLEPETPLMNEAAEPIQAPPEIPAKKRTRKTSRRKKIDDQPAAEVQADEPKADGPKNEKEILDDPAKMDEALETLSREIESASELIGTSDPTADSSSQEPSAISSEEPVAEQAVAEAEPVAEPISESQVEASAAQETSVEETVLEKPEEEASPVQETVSAEADSAPWNEQVSEPETVSPTIDETSVDTIADLTDSLDSSETAATTPIETEQEIPVETESAVSAEIDEWKENESASTVEVAPDEQAFRETTTEYKAEPSHVVPSPTKPITGTWRGTDSYSPWLVVHHQRSGRITEEYRALRTNLLSKYREDRFCLMVTSAASGEGKTITCLNLGLALAERTDRRTILVDYNFRTSRMGALLGARIGPGMAELIQGQATLEEAIQPTAYPNLFFLSAGRIEPSQAGEFMCRPELKTTVDALRKQFDYILVDTSAMNVYSDAGITGLLTGDALLVVRMKKTSKEDVDRAIRSLRSTNVRIMGMLLTHRPRGWFTK